MTIELKIRARRLDRKRTPRPNPDQDPPQGFLSGIRGNETSEP